MKKSRFNLIQMPLRHARIYIIPTRFGGVFLVGACVMLLVGATYQNNLVNLLAFFMFSLVFVAMVQTHNNLKDVQVDNVDFSRGFSGGDFVTGVLLKNKTSSAHFNIETSVRDLTLISNYDNRAPLLGMSTLRLRSAYRCPPRGRHQIKQVRLSSVFPLGLFYAWCWYDINSYYLIYPQARGTRPFPTMDDGQEESASHRSTAGGSDFHGHRRFEQGDSPRHVDWKARARGRPLMVKEFNEGASTSVILDWYSLDGLSIEDRLSQLAQWIDEATQRQVQFAMRTPLKLLGAGRGPAHAQRCLEHLALYNESDPSTQRGAGEQSASNAGSPKRLSSDERSA